MLIGLRRLANIEVIEMNLEQLKLVPDNQILVLDTETTGVNEDAEILQFSAIWGTGQEAMNIYIKPTNTRRWDEAMAVNHITPEMVAGCPQMESVKGEIESLLRNAKVIVGYNLPFDLRKLHKMALNYRLWAVSSMLILWFLSQKYMGIGIAILAIINGKS